MASRSKRAGGSVERARGARPRERSRGVVARKEGDEKRHAALVQPNEVNGRTDRELLSEADALALLSLKRGVLDNGKPAHERMRLSPQGHPNLYDVSLTLIKEGEVVVGVTSVVTELTGEGRI